MTLDPHVQLPSSEAQSPNSFTGTETNKTPSQKNPSQRNYIPWWKRKYLINRSLQFKYAFSAIFVSIFSSLLSVGLLLWSFWVFNIWIGQRLPIPVVLAIVFVFILNGIGIFVATILITHKVVGPMFNLSRQFARLAQGDFTAAARFRASDEMHYIARAFNEMVVCLRTRNQVIMDKVHEASEYLKSGNIMYAEQALQVVLDMHQREKALAENASLSSSQGLAHQVLSDSQRSGVSGG